MSATSTPSRISHFLNPASGVHAVLFYGAAPDAVSGAAEALAGAWLCQTPGAGGACGVCRSCVAFGRSNHVDFKLIVPSAKSYVIRISAITNRSNDRENEEDEQSLQDFFRTPPLLGNRKVAAIHRADRMNPQAANSILKLLEEPHPYAKLILTTTALSDVLPTILSRCANVPVESETEQPADAASQAMRQLAERTLGASPAEALLLSEKLKEAAVLFETEGGTRAAQASALRAFVGALIQLTPERPRLAQAAIEAHRRILGNGNPALVLDALFAELLLDP